MGIEKQIITRGFKAILSTKHEIKIDPQEVDMVEAAVEKGQPVRVRQGLINPAYLVAIVVDDSRSMRYASGPREDSKRLGIEPLGDIFQKALEHKQLGTGN